MAAESPEEAAPLQMRSIFVGDTAVPPSTDAESPPHPHSGLTHRASSGVSQPQAGDVGDFHNNDIDASSDEQKDEALDPIQLPQSTHSLLFSEPVCSLPFGFGFGILSLSFTCLALAFTNSIQTGGIPFNVTKSVRFAQYLSILIALLMEEEIPTGLYLLRMIPPKSLHQKFPQMRYRKFVFSSCIRIINGYFFLVNVLLVLAQANGVIEIFYDVLALQFVQQLDDTFALAKMDVFGKKLQRACTAKCFRAEFGQKRLGRNKNLSVFLKALYFLNLCGMLVGMAYVTVRQRSGYYQHESISVDFGSTIWEASWAKVPFWKNSTQEYEERTLVYSFFNGVYARSETEPMHAGRPVYTETRKFDRTPYEDIVPAEIRYCSNISAWVFMHPDIRKSKSRQETDPKDCGSNWLLRSPETYEYDLLQVVGKWQVWVGVIGKAELSITTNKCKDDSDCNLNGQCDEDGKCDCEEKVDGVKFFGSHCEVRLKDSCRTIIGERYNESFTVEYLRSWSDYGQISSNFGPDDLHEQYSRPVYYYVGGHPVLDAGIEYTRSFDADPFIYLIYSGSRWFGFSTWRDNQTSWETYLRQAYEYHAFWNQVYTTSTFFVSDPTTRSTPVGTDFYTIGERGEQYGPFGALAPLQLHNQTGRGYYRCGDDQLYDPLKLYVD